MSELDSLSIHPADASPAFDAVAREAVRPPIGRTLVGAALGAAVGASAWAAMVIFTDHSIGFAATGLGLLSGALVHWLSRGWRAVFPAVAAAASVVVALVVGKYAAFAYAIHRDALQRYGSAGGRYFGYTSMHTWHAFHATLGSEFSPLYLLWVGLGAVAAWRITGPAARA
jgi:hypothetical protein